MTTLTSEATSIWDLMKSSDAEAAHRWLRWHPSELDACIEARAAAMPAPLNREELAELREAHVRWGADDVSIQLIDRLASPNCRVVVAGQQPGVLAGPLYSVYKAMGAIKLAANLAQRHPDLQFVPIFWIASEDHDFAEVRKAIWPGARGEIVEMLIENSEWHPGRMVGTLKCEGLADSLIAQIRETTYDTEFRREIFELIAEAYAPDNTWEDGFARLFTRVFQGLGIVLVSPLMNWVRRRGKTVLEAEAAAPGESSRIVIERGEELKRAGMSAEIHRRADAVNCFYVAENNCRHALRANGDGIHYGGNDQNGAVDNGEAGNKSANNGPTHQLAASGAALAQRIAATPESFSYNVVTRPLVQDSILPTVAQLVGPGEAAYFAQVEAVYPRFNVFAPVRYPRPQVLLIQKNVERTLEKYNLTPEEAMRTDATRLAKQVLERDVRQGVSGEVIKMRERQIAEIRAIAAQFGDNKSIATAIDKLVHAMEKGYDTLQDRVLYRQQEDEGHLNQAMIRIEHSLSPAGKPQERTLNPLVPFAINYGLGWIRELANHLTVDPSAGVQTIRFSQLTPQSPPDSSAR